MSQEATVEIVSSSVGGGSSASTSNDGPAKLMKSGDQTDLDTDEYPHVTAHVNVDSPSGTVQGLSKETFEVHEDGEEREIVSFEFIDDALDLAFVFDDTGSMGREIDGAKAGVLNLTNSIDDRDIDARYALVSFKDDVEVDQRFTTEASRLKSSVDNLVASGGGDAPEANFDAIERALDLDWRPNAQRVIVDITDAPSHYRNDGSGFSEFTFDDVTRDLKEAGVTFISVAPDRENRTDSLKSVAGEVGGLWTDIKNVRSSLMDKVWGSSSSGEDAPENFQRVLERISSLIASTYVLTYFSCAPPGERTNVEITLNHPRYQQASDTGRVDVPGHFERHPDCLDVNASVEDEEESTEDTPGVRKIDSPEVGDEPPKVAKTDDGPSVAEVDDTADVVDIALIPDRDAVNRGDSLSVTVRDETGSRLKGVKVTASNETARTDSRGTCQLTLTEIPEETLTATKEDCGTAYGSDSVTITVRES